MPLEDLVSQYGPLAGVGLAIAFAAFQLGIAIANGRVKVTEARAAKEKAEATAIETLSNVTTSFVQLQHTAWERQNNTTQTLITTLAELTLTQKLSAEQASASGKAIATHMAAANTIQEAAQVASKLASTAMDASQTKILEDLDALATSIELIKELIKTQGKVDDEQKATTLARISVIEEYLKGIEKEKEQDETPKTDRTIPTVEPVADKPVGGTGQPAI